MGRSIAQRFLVVGALSRGNPLTREAPPMLVLATLDLVTNLRPRSIMPPPTRELSRHCQRWDSNWSDCISWFVTRDKRCLGDVCQLSCARTVQTGRSSPPLVSRVRAVPRRSRG